MINVLIGVVMFIALVGMMICSKKQKSSPNAQPIAMGLLVVIIVCGVAMLYRLGILGDGQVAQRMEQEKAFMSSQGYVVGKEFAAQHPDKVLVLGEANYAKDPYTQGIVKGLKDALGAGSQVEVDTVELLNKPKQLGPKGPDGAPEMMMPLQEVMTAKDMDATLKKHPGVKMIVSLIGLPRDKRKMKLWKEKDRPLLVLIGAYGNLAGMIKAGYINAVTVSKPKADYEASYPGTPEAAFKIRYLLVTKKNIEQVDKKYKNLLSM